MKAALVGAVLACLTNSYLFAQAPTNSPETPEQYAQARPPGKGFVISPEEAALQLRASPKPMVLDLRSAEMSSKLRVKGSHHSDFPDLLTPDAINRYRNPNTILILSDGSSDAVEAMVLLRLRGCQASAVSGNLNDLAQSIKRLEATTPVPGGSIQDTLEGSDFGAGGTLPPPSQGTSQASNGVARAEPFWRTVPVWFLTTTGGLILACTGLAVWFLVVQPRRRAKGLWKAADLLRGGGDSSLKDAESMLVEAINSGLKPIYLKEARFLLAYVKARLGQYPDALLVLKDSVPARDSSRETLYLDLWLKIKDKRWEEAELRWHEHGDVLQSFLYSKELAGIMFLEIGRQHLARKGYDLALACFQRVRELHVFEDQIPEHLTDLEMVLALNALFDETNSALAKERFEVAFRAAETTGRSTLLPRIGLLLCRWKDEDFPDVDAELAAILEDLKQSSSKQGNEAEGSKVLPQIALWYAVSLMYQWLLHLPKNGGLRSSHRDELRHRLDYVRSRTPEKGDADLIGGLVEYYCAKEDDERRAGVALLRKAIELGVTLPEILYLVQCEDRLAAAEKNRADSYLRLLKAYLSDNAAPLELRRELHEHLRKFDRFRQLGEISLESDDSAAPSLHDVAASSELVEERVQRMFRGYSDGQPKREVESLLDGLRKSREDLGKTVTELGKTEQKLMWVAGESLLPEEPETNEVGHGLEN